MGKRNDKLGRAAHIKRHTVGTSNEISFSVLDAAKNALEGDAGKDAAPRTPRFGHVSLFTLPLRRKKAIATPTKERGLPLSSGEFVSAEDPPAAPSVGTLDVGSPAAVASSAGPSAASAARGLSSSTQPVRSTEEEVARRKSRRRRRRLLAAALSVVVGLCLAGAGGWYLYHDYQRHLNQVAELDEALDLIRKADETAFALASIVAKPFDEASLAAADDVVGRVPEARAQLEGADQIARRVSVDLRESADKEAANQTVAAVAARLALLDSGRDIVLQAQLADDAARRARTAWENVVKGDALARDAAAIIVDTTAENVAASKEKTSAAVEEFALARDAIDELASAYPAADWSTQASYVAKRLEAMGYALASDDALLAKNRGEAAVQNDAYNRADAEAADIASELPDDAAEPVYEAYEQAVEPLLETYATARSQAGSADAFIRDYLGTPSK